MKINLTRFFFLLVLLCACTNADAQMKTKTENVVLITLDGFRWQELFTGADEQLVTNKTYVEDTAALKSKFWADSKEIRRELLMPFFWKGIVKQGQIYGNRVFNNNVNTNNKMWFSYPGYSEILCGFADDERINSNKKFDNPNKTVLEFINQQPAFKGKVAAFGSWDVFPFIMNERRSGLHINAGFDTAATKSPSEKERMLNELQRQIPSPWTSVRLDAFTHHYAKEYIKKNGPRVLFVGFGETDDFAHDGHYDSYLHAAHRTDTFIKDLWEFFQKLPQYKGKTTFIITTDHGRGTAPLESWRNHGSETPGSDQIWIAVMGPDTAPSGEQKTTNQLYQNQIASTLARLLGLIYTNETTPGAPIESAFTKP